MPLNLPEAEADAFRGGGPIAHLDFLNAAGYRIAGAAHRLGVFHALAEGPMSTKDIAGRIACDEAALGIMLSSLVHFGYIEQSNGMFGNSEQTTTHLVGSYSIVFAFWQEVLFELWADLETSIRTGLPAIDFYRWLEGRPETLDRFQTMLSRLSGMLTPEVLELTPVSPGTRLLDIGGGHASYSIAFAQKYPDLTATVVDLPAALATGTARIDQAGLSDRVNGLPWDITSATVIPGGPYDLVLLFNIVHGYRPDQVAALLSRVGAVAPGATLAVVEPLDDPVPSGAVSADAFVKVFSLNLFHGQGGRAYPYAQVTQWLTEAGFTSHTRHQLRASPNDQLIIAR